MKTGNVYLVGAGPGDPGLITLKGIQCLELADVVVFDRLIDKRLLGHAPADAEFIDVGKVRGKWRIRQQDINALLVTKAKEGNSVVRLKGGDPFVFGRGGEEAEVLESEGVPFEVVPGITSAIAAPAYAGIPLTHRNFASSITIVTGSEDPQKGESTVDWGKLSRDDGTLVVLMGWEHLPGIAQELMQKGRPSDTPVALVRWGTEPYQQTVTGTLSNIVDRGIKAGISPPVVVVIGAVVGLRDTLRWFDKRPLFGKRVLVTRTRPQAGTLSSLLSQRGAEAIEAPTIEIRPVDDYTALDNALNQLSAYEWAIFTSANAIDIVFDRLERVGGDARVFSDVLVGAIGPATATALKGRGIIADFVPESFVSEAMVEGLRGRIKNGDKVLLPRADIALETLTQGLAGLGAAVDEIAVYRTVIPRDSSVRVKEVLEKGVDVATFTSASTVRNLAHLLDDELDRLSGVIVACIGPITAAAARELGLKVDIVGKEFTINRLVDAIESYFKEKDLAK